MGPHIWHVFGDVGCAAPNGNRPMSSVVRTPNAFVGNRSALPGQLQIAVKHIPRHLTSRECPLFVPGESDSLWSPRLKTRVPVVAELGPVVVRLLVGVGDETNSLDLLVAVLGGRVQPQRRSMILGQGLPPISVTSSVCGCRQTFIS